MLTNSNLLSAKLHKAGEESPKYFGVIHMNISPISVGTVRLRGSDELGLAKTNNESLHVSVPDSSTRLILHR